jgi:hypothetical protein
VPHDEFILGGAASVRASFDDKRAGIGEPSFPAPNSVLDEYARGKVAMIRGRRSPRLSRHRSATCVRATVCFLDHQSDSSSAYAQASNPPMARDAARPTAPGDVGGRDD